MGMGLGALGAAAGAGSGLEKLLAERRAEQLMQQNGLTHLMSLESLMQNRAALQSDQDEKIKLARDKAASDAASKADALKQRNAENVDRVVGTFSPGQLIPMERYRELSGKGGDAFPKDLFSEQAGIGAAKLPEGDEGPTAPGGMKYGGSFSQLQKIKEDEGKSADTDWKLSIAQQLADMKAGGTQPDQNKLENQYRTILMRPLSSRSGGLGMEDQKVNQANHLIGLLDQYDGKPMPSNIAKELALGLARLTSPGGQVGVELMREIDQRTAQGSLGNLVSYVTGDPLLMNATPEKVRQVFSDSIERQGEIASQNRENAMSYIRSLAPTDLEEARRLKMESGALVPLRKRAAGAPPTGSAGAKPTAADLIKKYGG